VKASGLCSVCGEACFEVLETFPKGHPLAGTPKRTGQPNDDAMRVTLVMANGSLGVVTVREQYLPDLHVHLPAIWADVKARTRIDRKAHRVFGQQAFTAAQHAQADLDNLQFNDNIPLGVLCVERWKDHG